MPRVTFFDPTQFNMPASSIAVGGASAGAAVTLALTEAKIAVGKADGTIVAATLGGDVTAAVSGSNLNLTINADAITDGKVDNNAQIALSKFANIATGKILGNVGGSPGAISLIDLQTTLSSNANQVPLASAVVSYVDSLRQKVSWHEACEVATTGNLAANYVNGTNGVGATLTYSGGSQAAIEIDGETLTSGQRVLVKDQTAALQNGIYQVTTVGNGSTNWVLTRATDLNTESEALDIDLFPGAAVLVIDGSANVNKGFICSNATAPDVGTDAISWANFSAPTSFSAGAGMDLSGSTYSIDRVKEVFAGNAGDVTAGSGVTTIDLSNAIAGANAAARLSNVMVSVNGALLAGASDNSKDFRITGSNNQITLQWEISAAASDVIVVTYLK